jgi:hypothetical protein
MNKVILLRDSVAAPVRARNLKAGNAVETRRAAQAPLQAGSGLVAVWRINPASGRPECRWVQSHHPDEGASCRLLPHAA